MVLFYFDINIFFDRYSDKRKSRETERKKPALKRALLFLCAVSVGSFPLDYQ